MAINNISINPIGYANAWANTPCPHWPAHTRHRDPTDASAIELHLLWKTHNWNKNKFYSFDNAKENQEKDALPCWVWMNFKAAFNDYFHESFASMEQISVLSDVFSFWNKSPSRMLFKRILQWCFPVKLHNCFVDYESSPEFPSTWREEIMTAFAFLSNVSFNHRSIRHQKFVALWHLQKVCFVERTGHNPNIFIIAEDKISSKGKCIYLWLLWTKATTKWMESNVM